MRANILVGGAAASGAPAAQKAVAGHAIELLASQPAAAHLLPPRATHARFIAADTARVAAQTQSAGSLGSAVALALTPAASGTLPVTQMGASFAPGGRTEVAVAAAVVATSLEARSPEAAEVDATLAWSGALALNVDATSILAAQSFLAPGAVTGDGSARDAIQTILSALTAPGYARCSTPKPAS